MPEIDVVTVTTAGGRDLLAAAETGWTRPVPHCPDWDAAGLVGLWLTNRGPAPSLRAVVLERLTAS